LKELAELVGALNPNGTGNAAKLLADPWRYLADCFEGPGRRVRSAEEVELPSAAAIAGWHSRLTDSDDGRGARRYLRKRGISREVVRELKIGWDSDKKVLTFPMYDANGELVAFKTRGLRRTDQMRNCAGSGRAWPIYPE
jgi:hypothetical protein